MNERKVPATTRTRPDPVERPGEAAAEGVIVRGADWGTVYKSAQAIAPDALRDHGQVLNLVEGMWGRPGHGKPFDSPCDGTTLCTFPMLDLPTALKAVRFAAGEHEA